MDITTFRKKLINWFSGNRRPLPWRQNRNWYRIWISETMLQQTQVTQVIPYYHRFLHKFPNVRALASASLENLLKIWEGMGYYARARNLHAAARLIMTEYGGELPRDQRKIRDLPGFGPYTTNAVLSLAFNEPFSVVDGNVTRIICRLFAIDLDIRQPATKKIISQKADQLLDQEHAGVFNEAIMELGAIICTPRMPLCAKCPVSEYCQAKQQKKVDRIPYKSPPIAKPLANVTAYVVRRKNKFLLAQRPAAGLLGGFWEFPSILSEKNPDFSRKFPVDLPFTGKVARELQPVRHSFTHFNLLIKPVVFLIDSSDFNFTFYTAVQWTEYDEFSRFPMHRFMHKILDQIVAESEIVPQ